MSGRAAVFLDRDGVLNELVQEGDSGHSESPLRVQDVKLLAGAASGARMLSDVGFVLACASNQPAAAKGKVTVARLYAVHERLLELLAEDGVCIGASRLCLHHPHGVVPELTCVCACRKPAPGMLLDLAALLDIDPAASWMVGDTDADVDAGQAAGCRTLLIEHPRSAHKRGAGSEPDLRAPDLLAGAALLLAAVSSDISMEGVLRT